MRRLAVGIVIGVVVIVGAGAAAIARGLIFHDTAKPASIEDAVHRFQTSGGGRSKLAGVYLYATSGGESIDALGGANHRYPATTSVTAVGTRCGVRLRWDALVGRTATWTLCATPAGVELSTWEVVHTFFGRSDRTTYTCAVPLLLRAGSFHCRSARGGQSGRVTVVGREEVVVAGKAVSTLHVRTVARVTGGDHGTETADWWLGTQSGLPVRLLLSSRTSRPLFLGRVHYKEDVDLRLRSTIPKR
jgi:hypothetical protein